MTRPDAGPFRGAFGDYELLGEIARGGMGIIYRARQLSLNRLVAIKMLLAGEFASTEFIRGFQREAEAAANLQHPNIVAIHEIGEHEGQHYFSMELVEGRNLAELVRDEALPARRAAEYLNEIAQAIAYAHSKGTLHRDLKPSNILVDVSDRPRITDFGLAKQFHAGTDLTRSVLGFGSPSYMAPEQFLPELGRIGPTSDIYSLGAVLYHLLTGRPPFLGETVHQVIRQAQEVEPVAPQVLNPDVPPDLETICLKCLEKEPARRYQTADELAEELDRFRRGESICARPINRVERLWRWGRRRPMVAGLTGIVGLLLGTLVMGSWYATWRIALSRNAEFEQRERVTHVNQQLARANHNLQAMVTTLELQRAEQLFHSGESGMAVAQLVAILRHDPANHIAAERLVSALLHRTWILPVGETIRHPSSVSSVAYSPDGRFLVTGCEDGIVRVWGMPSRELLESLRHLAYVRSVSFSPDDSRVVTACDDGNVRIWNWRTSQVVVGPMSHEDRVFSVAFSPDGEWVVSASRDRTARVWSSRTGTLRRILHGHSDAIHQAVFSPDGTRIATASWDGSVRIWDAETGETIGSPLRHPKREPAIMSVSFSPDGTRLATASRDNTVMIWNTETSLPVLGPLRHTDGLNWVQFSPNGRLLATTGLDNTVQLLDAQTGVEISQRFRHEEQVNQAAFSPDGRTLATVGNDSSLRFWDVRPGRMLETEFHHASTANAIDFSRDGSCLAVASFDGTARVWDVKSQRPITPPLRHAANVQCVQFSPDETRIVTACGDGSARIWDLKTGRQIGAPFRHESGLWAASFSPDGGHLSTASADGTAMIWDIDSGQRMAPPLRHNDQVILARFSPDGTHVLTASRDRTARVWDAHTGAAVTGNLTHIDEVEDARFSPDGRYVATASKDNTGRIWNARTGEPIGQTIRHLRTVNAITFSHDGRYVVTASDDHTARVWNSLTGKPVAPPMEHGDAVMDACFSPDDERVVTASRDGTARVWDRRTAIPVSEPLEHDHPVKIARFSPDGEQVATGAFAPDYPVRIWQVPSARATIPDWLPAMAEAVAGTRIGAQGLSDSVPDVRLKNIREQLETLSNRQSYGDLARWFFADRTTRTVSPFQTNCVTDFVQLRIEENLRSSLENSVRVDPANPLALARLAKAVLSSDTSVAAKSDASHLARLALQQDPRQDEAREILRQIAVEPSRASGR